ncbi:hypothetical protein [Pontibacter mangrovi]|uniref:Uncharacterized protein n=1 Tax=Pontibacter mangrovi TaxID=2589816 RepID=A0A501W5J0_9BACT|nr:hypothetical protein [Pontibacter mangrovi]TPE42531.1 hypothetical protein FJM65_18190 [Pontibacter mangrovi]
MKKHVLLLAMMLLGATTFAQRTHKADDGLDAVVLSVELDGPAMASMEMKRELNLSEEQYVVVAQLNESRYAQLREAEQSFAANPAQRTQEFRHIHLKTDENLKNVLTPEQLQNYQALEGHTHLHLITEKGE